MITMNLTVSETIDICEALRVGLRAAKDSHMATDADVERVQQVYAMLESKQFTDTRTKEEFAAAYMEDTAKECSVWGCD